MNKLVKSVRATGAPGVVGAFEPEDPKAEDPLMRQGQIAFDIGLFLDKSLRTDSGQTPVNAYNGCYAGSSPPGRHSRRSWSRTSCLWRGHPMRTNISTPARTAGQRWC
jgi:hypothetical protein